MFALTPRLTLRPGWPEDAPALTRAIAHESVVRHLLRVPWPYALSDAEAFLSMPRGSHEPRFLIAERGGDYRLVGGIGLMPNEHNGHEFGYWIVPDAWGRGYATEAGRAVIDIARHALGIARLSARHHLDNPASGRVLRKLGFRETGRSRQFSLGRASEVECAEFAIDLADDQQHSAAIPIAA